MNFSKQYIIQAISVASNNLRLSTDKIESVTILKTHIENSENLEENIEKMKAKTELSKFAIKLGEAYRFTQSAQIDFLRISEVFKEHANNLVIELSNLLDVVTPEKLHEIFNETTVAKEIAVELKRSSSAAELTDSVAMSKFETENAPISEDSVQRDELKEELILGEIEPTESAPTFNFDDFEEEILKPISQLESLLKKFLINGAVEEDLRPFIQIMKKNAEFSQEIGFTILTEMHEIFYTAFEYINNKKIVIEKNLIESLRACLIVIVAVVRSKDVDITNYLNKAEKLGKFLKLN